MPILVSNQTTNTNNEEHNYEQEESSSINGTSEPVVIQINIEYIVSKNKNYIFYRQIYLKFLMNLLQLIV